MRPRHRIERRRSHRRSPPFRSFLKKAPQSVGVLLVWGRKSTFLLLKVLLFYFKKLLNSLVSGDRSMPRVSSIDKKPRRFVFNV
jgi:hypothetical protein